MLKIDTPLNPAATGAAAEADAVRLQARATEAAEKFEAFFIKQMMSQMRSATRALADDDSPLKNKVNEDMMDMADGLVADAMAGQRAFGIADLMLKQILPKVNLSPAGVASPSRVDESNQGIQP
ncbi:rod-binding protein [Roseateles cavernae]|uniref:rod-binding protein n=1 Tax=Roseateles cavernae TaxID=3153578 RepID=UPI0032E504FB